MADSTHPILSMLLTHTTSGPPVLALALCRSFSGWASLACRLLSLFLYSKFVDMTINLSLILKATRIQEQFPLSVFVFIDSLVVSSLQDAGGYAIPRQKNLELPYLFIELFYIGMPLVRTDGRSVGRTVTWLQKFLEWVDYRIFLSMGLRYRWFSLWRRHIVKSK